MATTFWSILAACLWVCGAGTLGYQVYQWLRLGVWLPLNALTLLNFTGDAGAQAWVMQPQSWLGVHAIFAWMPMSATLVLLALVALIIGLAFVESAPADKGSGNDLTG